MTKIVYLILAHNNAKQLEKLIERLDYRNNSFVIHFDLNGNDSEYNKIEKSLGNKNNVYFSKRNRCYWGDISLVNASIDCIKTAYKYEINFEYAVLISGQHYPIKTNEYIERIFKNASKSNFISYFKLPSDNWSNGGIDRLVYYHLNKHPRKHFSGKKLINKTLSLVLRKTGYRRVPPININSFYGGSQWWCLTNECCVYILNYIKEKPKVYKYFKNVLIPDEIFFQTILLNSKYKETIVNNNFNYIDWGSNLEASPMILNESHYEDLKTTPDLWARKFDINKSKNLVSLLDTEIEYKKNSRL